MLILKLNLEMCKQDIFEASGLNSEVGKILCLVVSFKIKKNICISMDSGYFYDGEGPCLTFFVKIIKIWVHKKKKHVYHMYKMVPIVIFKSHACHIKN